MKFLIDNNLSYKLTELLKPAGIVALHIKNELSIFSLDREIWEFAKEHEFVILTKDNDFNELSQLFGCPPKIVQLICGNRKTTFVSNLIISNKSELVEFINSDRENCLLKLSV